MEELKVQEAGYTISEGANFISRNRIWSNFVSAAKRILAKSRKVQTTGNLNELLSKAALAL